MSTSPYDEVDPFQWTVYVLGFMHPLSLFGWGRSVLVGLFEVEG